jgi:hypothetical protein
MPVTAEINEFALTVAEQAKLVIIKTSGDCVHACETLKDVVKMRREVADHHRPMIEAAHRAHKIAIEQQKKVDAPLAEAELFLKREIGTFTAAQERIRRAEEQRLQVEARKKAGEEARKKAEEQTIKDALDAEQDGNSELAESILANPAPIAPLVIPKVTVAPVIPKQEGIASRTNWKFRIVNESLIPREYLKPDEKKIGEMVRTLAAETKIPGVEVFAEETVSVRLA